MVSQDMIDPKRTGGFDAERPKLMKYNMTQGLRGETNLRLMETSELKGLQQKDSPMVICVDLENEGVPKEGQPCPTSLFTSSSSLNIKKKVRKLHGATRRNTNKSLGMRTKNSWCRGLRRLQCNTSDIDSCLPWRCGMKRSLVHLEEIVTPHKRRVVHDNLCTQKHSFSKSRSAS
ncbi:OLC1v1001336C1 [Oldenlandia corymbosa var. corymbosa]|uniref:OLC1v1001336C1 n=1 Tax=Oldenlandia corymbosa var. corymbosa TaxID=529605 RepID=A0AAV1D518_OLDCO|nr:OLC1v1001336C1 [Oldenlandia corymbosa var. corymbosa]